MNRSYSPQAPGLILLDIDGTTTTGVKEVPEKTSSHLRQLHSEGWTFAFVTGRSYGWAAPILEYLAFPSLLGVQNGAALIDMSTKREIFSHSVSLRAAHAMSRLCIDKGMDVVLYAGYSQNDRCYFRPQRFSAEMRGYLERRVARFGEDWIAVADFDGLPLGEFASLKCFGPCDILQRLEREVQEHLGLHMPVIRDPFDTSVYVAQATHAEANKGAVLNKLREYLKIQGPVIAAGDDFNDLSMLEQADIGIAMGTAPEALKGVARVHAPPAEQCGLVDGLKEAVRMAGLS